MNCAYRWEDWYLIIELLGISGWLLQLPITFVAITLDYENRWYLLSDRSLRIREGVYSVKEQTLTFANIQNLSLKQGPIQRWLGIADLEVHTAGGGSKAEDEWESTSDHTGRLRGVANGEELRDRILARVRRTIASDSKETLPDGVGSPSPPLGSSLVSVSQDLLREVQQLRSELA